MRWAVGAPRTEAEALRDLCDRYEFLTPPSSRNFQRLKSKLMKRGDAFGHSNIPSLNRGDVRATLTA